MACDYLDNSGSAVTPPDFRGKRKYRKSPRFCPRCGRRMFRRGVLYECPGCNHLLSAPMTKRRLREPQPIDNVVEQLRWQLNPPPGDPYAEEVFVDEVRELKQEQRAAIVLVIIGFVCTLLWRLFDSRIALSNGQPDTNSLPVYEFCTVISLGLVLGATLSGVKQLREMLLYWSVLAVMFFSLNLVAAYMDWGFLLTYDSWVGEVLLAWFLLLSHLLLAVFLFRERGLKC